MSADMKTIDDALAAAVDAATTAGASDAEACYVADETQFIRFASSRFTQVGSTEDIAVRIRVIADGRLGSQMSASLDREALAETARAAVDVARLSPKLDVDLSFAGEGTTTAGEPPPIADSATAAGAPALLADAFAPHRERGVLFAGSLKSHLIRRAVRTHRGCARQFATSSSDAQVIGLADGSSGYAGSLVPGDQPLDLAAITTAAADRALRGRDPVDLEPGRYDVILAPPALAELLEWMSMVSFGATSMLDGTSLLSGREGAELCDERITLVDRPGPGDCTFDAEGSPRSEVVFIDRGRGGKVVTDRITAARLGDDRGSTGHAPPIEDSFATGPTPQHLFMAAGDDSADDLLGAVERGIYVTRLHYVNGLLNPRKATMTGMTRDGTFLIEDGVLGRGVSNLRFTENMLEALGRLGGLGRDLVDVPTWWSEGGTLSCPAVLIRDFRFTGKSR